MLTTKVINNAATTQGVTVNFSGKWRNQLGSTMTIITSGQSITGKYISPVSGGGGTVEGDLVGWTDGDLVSFVVNWAGPASLTAWTGQLVDEGGVETMKTLWQLVQNIQDSNEPTGLWMSTL